MADENKNSPLNILTGTWRGTGKIVHKGLAYREELSFDRSMFPGKPILTVTQKTYGFDGGRSDPLHSETGFLRTLPPVCTTAPVNPSSPSTSSGGLVATTVRDPAVLASGSTQLPSQASSSTSINSLMSVPSHMSLTSQGGAQPTTTKLNFNDLQPLAVRQGSASPWHLVKNYTFLYSSIRSTSSFSNTDNPIDTHYIRAETNAEHTYVEWCMAYPFGMASVESGWITQLNSEGGHGLLIDTWCEANPKPAQVVDQSSGGSDREAPAATPVAGMIHAFTAKSPKTTAFRRIIRIVDRKTMQYEFYLKTSGAREPALHLIAELKKVQ
ncbi:hypothetical protein IWQ60_002623 [Tieghemiomyces parasiticus]|uniref:THAP4-like heme-binding domain-containing protein n=1 Tax=Tieghemiomyces parasiticus TaxID=78921 RepID=A0A9W8AIS6_9FUNG|nr:hypothetical protein IWQ60_002623 [Tieghemiomyces parasiticus]